MKITLHSMAFVALVKCICLSSEIMTTPNPGDSRCETTSRNWAVGYLVYFLSIAPMHFLTPNLHPHSHCNLGNTSASKSMSASVVIIPIYAEYS